MNERRTIDKCKKILTMFEELKPRKQPQPVNRRKSLKSFNSKIHNRSCSLSETKSKDKYKYVLNTSCLSKKSLKQKKDHLNVSKSNSINKYSTPYNKETRYDKIMKLNVKPSYQPKQRRKESFVNSSFTSVSSLNSQKQNRTKSKSRLDKIMNIKVSKPQVSSTLVSYKPEKKNKLEVKKRSIEDNQILLMKECKEKIKRMEKQSTKEDRLWKAFERERELRVKSKKDNVERSKSRERSIEKRFESLVSKELKRIQSQNELKQRKNGGFSQYVFPSY